MWTAVRVHLLQTHFLSLSLKPFPYTEFMDDEKNGQEHHGPEKTEPVRSRWTPKPEQILILESIFNGGMVNPPKEETIRIRKLLEKFGSVGDANVFYWFQNRRSRSRRRQRQMQTEQQQKEKTGYFQTISSCPTINYSGPTVGFSGGGGSGSGFAGSSAIVGGGNNCGFEDIYGYDGQIENNSGMPSLNLDAFSNSQFHHHTGFITVFINGVQTEVPSGSIDMKAIFGENVVLIHSSGITVPFNEYGFLLHTLQHGESYFLVSRGT